jgi:hypothetical protein
MFSATKFVIAGAIVALFGGFLLSGVLTQPSEEAVPAAAVSASPSTSPDLLPGVDLVTEEVEPGVFRVLSDGTDNDMGLGADGSAQVVAGQEGSVWVRDQQGWPEVDRLFRLGLAGSTDASRIDEYWPDISVAPDGVVWALGGWNSGWPSPPEEGELFSLADGEWTKHSVPDGVVVTGIETPADGSVWTTWDVRTGDTYSCWEEKDASRLAVARLVDGEWQEEGV